MKRIPGLLALALMPALAAQSPAVRAEPLPVRETRVSAGQASASAPAEADEALLHR